MELETVKIEISDGLNIIIGQSHFIKTVEDIYETLVSSSPSIKFGIAFCESSGPSLIRYEGNDVTLKDRVIGLAKQISAGHVFVILLRNAFPINVLNRIKLVDEVASVFCATGNPIEVVVIETEMGRGVLGVIDGYKSRGVESKHDRRERHELLRRIGYKCTL